MTILLNAVLTAESVARSSVPFCSLLHSLASQMQPTDICSGSIWWVYLEPCVFMKERPKILGNASVEKEAGVTLESIVRGGGWLSS